MRNSSPPCEWGEGRKAAGGFRAAEDSGPYGRSSSYSVGADVPIRPFDGLRTQRYPPSSAPCGGTFPLEGGRLRDVGPILTLCPF